MFEARGDSQYLHRWFLLRIEFDSPHPQLLQKQPGSVLACQEKLNVIQMTSFIKIISSLTFYPVEI